MDSLNPSKVKAAVNYIDTWLEFNFDSSRLPGMQVAIQHKDRVVYSRSFGFADVVSKKKLTNQNVLRVASHSKTFTATAIMQLVEEGALNLDDKVSKHLVWFKSSEDKRVAEVTVRQLMNHTAGVIRDGDDVDYWQVLREFPTRKELQSYVSKSYLVYDADEKFKYSNFGYGYLGLVVEAASGTSYREYITKNIIDKLGLKSTGADLDAKAKKLLATGYGMELFGKPRRAFEHIDTNDLSSATGVYSNAEDLCKYFSAHFIGNTTLLSDKSKRQMQHGYWKPEGVKDQRYGLGLINYKKKGWSIYGHSGGFPGFITNTRFEPKLELVVSALTNVYDSPASKVCGKVIDIIDTFQQDTDHVEAKIKEPSKFEGRFYSTWGAIDFVFVGNKPFAIDPMDWAAFDDAEELSVIDDVTLKIEKTSGYSYLGETVKFHFDAKDKAKSITYAGRTMLPLEEARKRGFFGNSGS